MESDVTERSGAEQGVAQGVNGHIAVRMGDATLRVRDLDTPEHQPQPVGQRMDIISVSDSEICHNVQFWLPK